MKAISAAGQQPGQEAVSALWRDFSKPLRAYLRSRTRTDADADDLLQAVFLRIQRQLPSLRESSKMQGWLYRIARNAVIDHYRTRKEHAPVDAELVATDPDGRDALDLAPALRGFIVALPPKYRDPLVQHEFQGASIQEVAAGLDLSLTAAKSRVRRARLMLREMLDQCCRFEFDRRGRVIEAIPRVHCECGDRR